MVKGQYLLEAAYEWLLDAEFNYALPLEDRDALAKVRLAILDYWRRGGYMRSERQAYHSALRRGLLRGHDRHRLFSLEHGGVQAAKLVGFADSGCNSRSPPP